MLPRKSKKPDSLPRNRRLHRASIPSGVVKGGRSGHYRIRADLRLGSAACHRDSTIGRLKSEPCVFQGCNCVPARAQRRLSSVIAKLVTQPAEYCFCSAFPGFNLDPWRGAAEPQLVGILRPRLKSCLPVHGGSRGQGSQLPARPMQGQPPRLSGDPEVSGRLNFLRAGHRTPLRLRWLWKC